MSTIRVIYHDHEPKFPATDQHPDAQRYEINHPKRGRLLIDATGGEPTVAEIDGVLDA